MSNFERHQQARAKLSEGNKGAVFDALASTNITEVHVEFDGEGDSGQIQTVTAFRGEERIDLPATTVRVLNVAWGNAETVATVSALVDAVETLCYDYLEDTHGGWENNDGGYGEFRLDVATRTVSLEINERYTETHTSEHTF
jgi:hypothetical protein